MKKTPLIGNRSFHMAPYTRRFEITYVEIGIGVILLMLVAAASIRDWVAAGVAADLATRIATIQLSLDNFLKQRGTVTPGDVLERVDTTIKLNRTDLVNNRLNIIENRRILCAVLARLHGQSEYCTVLALELPPNDSR